MVQMNLPAKTQTERLDMWTQCGEGTVGETGTLGETGIHHHV